MRRHIDDGLAPAEAATLALGSAVPADGDRSALAATAAQLREALDSFDEPQAQVTFDRLLGIATVDTLLSEVVLPYLEDLGARWERGEASIAQEHFASGLLRGRLLGIASGWGRGLGPLAVLACVAGERHELGLISFGLALHELGWRIVYLGADAPVETVAEVSDLTVALNRAGPARMTVRPPLLGPPCAATPARLSGRQRRGRRRG